MIHRPFEVILDDRQREQLQGYDPGFPYTAIDCHFDDYSGQFVDWHWHATLEVNICVSGVLKTCTQRGEYLVRPGDAVLVNANVLHRNEAEGGARGVRVQTHMFDRALVAAAELPLRRYVAPVVECALLDALPAGCLAQLPPDAPRGARIPHLMAKALSAQAAFDPALAAARFIPEEY